MPALFGARRVAVLGRSAAVVAGTLASNFASTGLTPSVHVHVHTATKTFMGGNATFSCTVASTTTYSTITLSGWSGDPIAVGMELYFPQINDEIRVTGIGTFNGVSGTVTINPVFILTGTWNCTASGDRVCTSIDDRAGNPALTSSGATAPIYKTDEAGIGYLDFSTVSTSTNVYTRMDGTLTVAGLDSHYMAWFMVMRAKSTNGGNLLGIGAYPSGTALSPLTMKGSNNNVLTIHNNGYIGSYGGPFEMANANPVNRNKMVVGSRKQVIGNVINTTDSYLGTSGNVTNMRYYRNDQTVSITNTNYVGRSKGLGAYTLGRGSQSGSNDPSQMHLYELVGFTQGQLTPANTVAKGDAIRDILVANHAVVPTTKRTILMGDSRMDASSLAAQSSNALLLTEPGRANALPANWDVLNFAYSGGTMADYFADLAQTSSILDTGNMLPGDNNSVACWVGTNEIANAGEYWFPTDTTANTAARADAVYSGSSYGATFTASFNGANIDVIDGSVVGVVHKRQVLSGTGVAVGTSFAMNGSGGGTAGTGANGIPVGTTRYGGYQFYGSTYPPVSNVAVTATFGSHLSVFQTLLARGFRVLAINDFVAGAGGDQLRLRYSTNLIADCSAGAGQTNDGKLAILNLRSEIVVAGKFILGADQVSYRDYLNDTIHTSRTGRIAVNTGGDDPTKGLKARLVALAP